MAMFGALNRFIGRLDADPNQKSQSNRGVPCGFQVLRNDNKELHAEPWYDFVVGINGRIIDNPDPYLFSQEIKNCAGASVTLTIWTAKGQQTRDVQLPIPSQEHKLGLTLQWTQLAATENVWHILDVIPNSPADQAGLLPYGDYIIGTPEGLIQGESGLGELVEDFMARPLRLWVYNHEYAVTRPLTITPSRNWGGEGALGCVLGFGALHRIPPPLTEPPSGPGDTLFETARFSNEEARTDAQPDASRPDGQEQENPARTFSPSSFITPATSLAPPPGAKPAGASRAQRKGRGGAKANQDFDSMWKESEEKSKELDHAPPTKASAVPPPPKQDGGNPTPPPKQDVGNLTPPVFEERTETASPAPILDDDDDDDDDDVE